ncbi:MAG: galactose mutarotase [Treponema sp.]|jgi:aldose 1-epimerase|nr:galactose mutarotase [Treponema sp.]
MKISKKPFGVLSSGKEAYLYILEAGDLTLTVSTFGAHWVSLFAPSRRGKRDDILLGYDTLGHYIHNKPYFGATIGRFANRIGGGGFSLEGTVYKLSKNEGNTTLHGGRRGFDKRLWKAEPYEEKDGVFIRLSLKSPHGDEGFPGSLKAQVSYGLTKSNEIIAHYQAQVDAPCPVNLTNHAYFNLAGEGSGDILSHRAVIHAESYVEVDENRLPTGALIPARQGPFDFTAVKNIGQDMDALPGTPKGYDHCFVLSKEGGGGKLRPCAEIAEEVSGRAMRIHTTMPGVQLYTGNFLDGVPGKAGSVYQQYGGFCLETQYLPDSPNKPDFPSCIFGPGRDFHEKTIYKFEVLKKKGGD